jgi:hypothetical protein
MGVEQHITLLGKPCGTHSDGRRVYVCDGQLYTSDWICLGDWFEICQEVREKKRPDLQLDHIS